MAYTNSWDNTFPPDTQAIKLGAQDIRNLKVDITDRLPGFGAGLKANLVNPEAVFGNAGAGVQYFATDTGQLYRWNGTSWILIGLNKVLADTTVATLASPTAGTVLNSVTIPGNILTPGAVIDIMAGLSVQIADASHRFGLFFGGTDIMQNNDPTFTSPGLTIRGSVIVIGATSQMAVASCLAGSTSFAGQFSCTENVAGNIIVMTQVLTNTTATVKTLGLAVRIQY